MSQILLDIPEDSLLALRVSALEMGEELRMAAAFVDPCGTLLEPQEGSCPLVATGSAVE